ncbi:MAG: pyruvate kinase [Deltaproteobacteria bacterium CG11_big_fil_rev_8_21_14_0_20_45_16]|nr:MAG: pyruvate kinase [Deltaproteobacteria bacterium CG11_big_fil_rev_8_21_14_0_20_45_16]
MGIELILTLGPSSLKPEILKKIDQLGHCIYRINGAHESPETLPELVAKVRQILPSPKLMLDLPGNKVRTKNINQPIEIRNGEQIAIKSSQLNYPDFYKHLQRGMLLYANDSTSVLKIISSNEEEIILESHSDGTIGNNKGLHVQGIHADIPFLFQKDQELIKAAVSSKVPIVSLSYVRNRADIRQAKNVAAEVGGDSLEFFAKVETAAATLNLAEIFDEVDTINVDRGDLSSDIGLLKLPAKQERIIDVATSAGKRVFLATQFLKNMELNPVPLIAELVHIYNVFRMGIAGIQLSEETAIGRYPYECAELVFNLYRESMSA